MKIRFIDSHYKPLFFVESGENIIVRYKDGSEKTSRVTFLDDTHFESEVGSRVYHICEFAEKMEALGAEYFSAKPLDFDDFNRSIFRDAEKQAAANGYRLKEFCRKSGHPEDFYMFVAMCQHQVKLKEYSVWDYNSSTGSLNIGSYQLDYAEALKEFARRLGTFKSSKEEK